MYKNKGETSFVLMNYLLSYETNDGDIRRKTMLITWQCAYKLRVVWGDLLSRRDLNKEVS